MNKFSLALVAAGALLIPTSVRATLLPAGSIVDGTNQTAAGMAVNGSGRFAFNTSIQYAVFREAATGHLDFLFQVTNQGPPGADSIDHVSSLQGFNHTTMTVGFVSPTDPALANAGFTTAEPILNPTSVGLTSNGEPNWSFSGGAVPPFASTAILVVYTDATAYGLLGMTRISNDGVKDFYTWAPSSNPEPASFVLLASCFGGLGLCRGLRRTRKVLPL